MNVKLNYVRSNLVDVEKQKLLHNISVYVCVAG